MPATGRMNSNCACAGATYEEVARAGGGIVSSVKALRAASEDELVRQTLPRLDALIAEGVTTVEIKSGYGLDLANERKSLRAARRLARERASQRSHDLPRRACAAARSRSATGRLYRPAGRARCCRRSPPKASPMRSTAFARRIAFSPDEIARVFAAAKALGLPVKLHADQLSNLHGAALAARFGALSADHLEHTDEAGVAAMAKAGTVAVLLPGAFYFIRETKRPPIDLFRRHGVADGGRDRLQSRHFAADFAAAGDEHGGDFVSHECRGMHRRRHARGGAGARASSTETGTLEAGKWADLAIWDIERPAELVYRMGFNPLHAARLEGPVSDIVLKPGAVPLADWLAIYRGAAPRLDPACRAGHRGERGRGRADRRQGRAGLWNQHRLRQARQRAHRRGRSREAAAQHRAVACRGRRRGDAGRRSCG